MESAFGVEHGEVSKALATPMPKMAKLTKPQGPGAGPAKPKGPKQPQGPTPFKPMGMLQSRLGGAGGAPRPRPGFGAQPRPSAGARPGLGRPAPTQRRFGN
jgi:hypothetical protein